MEILQIIITIIVAFGVPIMSHLWLSRKMADYQTILSKEVEDYKKEINKELESHKIQLQADLQTKFHKFQTNYDSSYPKRVEIIEYILVKIQYIENRAKSFVYSNYIRIKTPNEISNAEFIRNTCIEIEKKLDKKYMYLPEEVVKILREMNMKCLELINALYSHHENIENQKFDNSGRYANSIRELEQECKENYKASLEIIEIAKVRCKSLIEIEKN